MNRRSFIALAGSALLVPEPERVRAYSFLPGERGRRAEPVVFLFEDGTWQSVALTRSSPRGDYTMDGVCTVGPSPRRFLVVSGPAPRWITISELASEDA